jgi:predicted nucleic acid-binding protein
MRIYLDVCCLSRPFDDFAQDRVRLEAEAIYTIFNSYQSKHWILLNSEAISIETSKISDFDKRKKIEVLCSMLSHKITINERIEKRALELEEKGFKSFDALHIAYAEEGRADILFTTDDDLLKKAKNNKNILKVMIENPIRWISEVIIK